MLFHPRSSGLVVLQCSVVAVVDGPGPGRGWYWCGHWWERLVAGVAVVDQRVHRRTSIGVGQKQDGRDADQGTDDNQSDSCGQQPELHDATHRSHVRVFFVRDRSGMPTNVLCAACYPDQFHALQQLRVSCVQMAGKYAHQSCYCTFHTRIHTPSSSYAKCARVTFTAACANAMLECTLAARVRVHGCVIACFKKTSPPVR